MIIDWTKKSSILTNIISEVKDDVNSFEEKIWSGESIILRIKDGLRLEILPYIDTKEFDIKDISKNFNEIYESNKLKQEAVEAERKFRESIKDNPDIIEKFDELLKLRMELDSVKCDVNIIETINNKSKTIKTISHLTIPMVKIYVLGFILSIIGVPEIPSRAMEEIIKSWHKK